MYPSIPFKLPLIKYIKLLAPSNELLRDLRSNKPSTMSSRKISPNLCVFKSDLVTESLANLQTSSILV